ncbi:MAG: nickel insertion protein [Thermodesulfobacteriota bacterium]
MKKNVKRLMFEERGGLILLFHIDHLSGEEMGWALEDVEIPGLRNRHLIPTMTKKGRPGYLLLLDIDPRFECEAVEALSNHIPVFGYHRLNTDHVFSKGNSGIVKVVVKTEKKSIGAKVHIRSLPCGRSPCRFFVESDDLVNLQRRIKKELRVHTSPLELKRNIEFLLVKSNKSSVELRL